MSSDAAPRVNFETMQKFIGRKVTLCCAVQNMENGKVLVQTSDKATVTILSGPLSGDYNATFLEVTGTVQDPKTIQESDHINLSDNFNLEMYNELVKLSHGKHLDMFL